MIPYEESDFQFDVGTQVSVRTEHDEGQIRGEQRHDRGPRSRRPPSMTPISKFLSVPNTDKSTTKDRERDYQTKKKHTKRRK